MTPESKPTRYNELIRISDYTVNTFVMENEKFSNCRIVGPAILVPTGTTQIVHCDWPGDLNSIFWEILPGRTQVFGAVEVRDCVFSGCRFEYMGLAGQKALLDVLKKGFQSG